MSIGTSNATEVLITPEVTFGVIPATPVFEKIRLTGESISDQFETIVSNEIRNDRNRADTVRVSQKVEGGMDFELSVASFNTVIQAVMAGTFSAPVANLSSIKNGVVKRSYTIQKKVADLTPVFYENFTGCRFGSLDISLKSGEFVTASTSVMGKASTIGSAIITGQTTAAEITTTPFNAIGNIQAILDNGATSTELYRSMTINMNNNLRMLMAIGNLGPVEINYGVFDVTGNIEFYFQNSTVYNRLINNTSFSMAIRIQDSTGDYYNFKFPKMRLETGEITAGGLDQDMIVTCTYRAIYDPVALCTVEIEKFDAP